MFDAYTKPELLKKWLGVRGGWSLAVAEIDLRVGGAYRCVWRKAGQPDMGMGGVFTDIAKPERVVATEKFDDAWYDGDALSSVVLTESGGKTLLTMTITYSSKKVRAAVLKSPMDQGVGESFDMLDGVLVTMAKK